MIFSRSTVAITWMQPPALPTKWGLACCFQMAELSSSFSVEESSIPFSVFYFKRYNLLTHLFFFIILSQQSAYPAESVAVSINAVQLTYHKACFKCSECQLTLTLKTYKVGIYINSCCHFQSGKKYIYGLYFVNWETTTGAAKAFET